MLELNQKKMYEKVAYMITLFKRQSTNKGEIIYATKEYYHK